MSNKIEFEIPDAWAGELDWQDQSLFTEIILLGLRQYRLRQALAMLEAQVGTLGYIAELTRIPKADLIREARMRGMDPRYSEDTLKEDLKLD